MATSRRGFRARALAAALGLAMLVQPLAAGMAAAGPPVPDPAGQPATELIVKYKSAISGAQVSAVQTLGARVAKQSAGLTLVRVNATADAQKVAAQLRKDPTVQYVEPNYRLYAQAEPTDPEYVAGNQWAFDAMSVPGAWDLALEHDLTGLPVKVAVLDTGVDPDHEDLVNRLGDGVSMITGGDSADWHDVYGHGTHVAGIIAAETNNGLGIAGVTGAFGVQVLPVKVLGDDGVGSLYDVALGIRWAADHGAGVINMSLGARLPDLPVTLADAVSYAQQKKAIVVAAAGNDGKTVAGMYPAALPGVISVGAHDKDGALASFSATGYDVAAPGVEIMSTLPTADQYGVLSGTSMATPFVSGIIAVLRRIDPDLDADTAQLLLSEGYSDTNVSFYRAVNFLVTDAVPEPKETKLTLVDPRTTDEDHVLWQRGTFTARAVATVPAAVKKVAFTLTQVDNGSTPADTLTATVEAAAATNGEFAADLDSTEVKDGYYLLTAKAFDASDKELASAHAYLAIANNNSSGGLAITVRRPDDTAAAGAPVVVLSRDQMPDEAEPTYEVVANIVTNHDGVAWVPPSRAPAGNDYLVVTWGTEPYFVYQATVRAPADTPAGVTLSAATDSPAAARAVTLSAIDGSATALTGGLAHAALPYVGLNLEGNPKLTQWASLGKLGSEGNQVYLSPGTYDLRLVQTEQRLLLAARATVTATAAASVVFSAAAADTGTLVAAAGTGQTPGDLDLGQVTGLPEAVYADATDPVRVSPGEYRPATVITAIAGDTTWKWSVQAASPATVSAGQATAWNVGGRMQAEITPESAEVTSQYLSATMAFTDNYGNVTTALNKNEGMSGWTIYPQVVLIPTVAGESAVTDCYDWDSCDLELPDAVSYTLKATVEAGPLAPDGAGGTVTSPGKTVTYNTATGGYAVTVKGRDGAVLPNAHVLLYQFKDGEYSESYWANATDTSGHTSFSGMDEFDPSAQYKLLVYGPASAGSSEQMAFVQTLDLSSGWPAQGVVASAASQSLVPVTVSAQGAGGQALSGDLAMQMYSFSAVPLLATFTAGSAPATYWVPAGEYGWGLLHKPAVGETDHYMLLSPRAAVSGATSVTLSAAGTGRLTVQAAAGSDYDSMGLHLAPVGRGMSGGLDLGKPPVSVWITPGDYHLFAYLSEKQFDSEWMYSLKGTFTINANGEHTETLGGPYTAELQLSQSTYVPGAQVKATPKFLDQAGHQLMWAGLYASDYCWSCNWNVLWTQEGRLVNAAGHRPGAPSTDLQAQNHQSIAPFFSLLDPDGKEISRSKSDEFYVEAAADLPAGAAIGQYTARVELDAGPDGTASAEQSFHVGDAAAPTLDPITSPTNKTALTVTGTATAGATVTVTAKNSGGSQVAQATATADSGGTYSVNLTLPGAGTFTITAQSVLGSAAPLDSAPRTVTVDQTAPAKPGNLQGMATDDTHITLTWTAPADTDVAGYIVKRGGTEVGRPTALSFSDSGLTAATTYAYTVQAVDQATNVSAAASVSVKTLAEPDTQAPSAPTGFSGVYQNGKMKLTWQAATDNVAVAKYRLERSLDGSTWASIAEVTAATLTYTDTGPTGGFASTTDYHYRLAAVDAANNQSAQATTKVLTPDFVAPGQPQAFTAAYQKEDGKVHLSWADPAETDGVTGYRLERSANGTTWTTLGELAADARSYADAGPSTGWVDQQQYTYRLYALDAAANVSTAATTTATLPDITPPSTPADFTATYSYGDVYLSWQAATDNTQVTGYRLQRSTDGTTWDEVAAVSAWTYWYSDEGPTGGFLDATAYQYRLVATDAAGNLSAAATTSVTTPDTEVSSVSTYGAWSGYGVVRAGGTLTIYAQGTANRTATARVDYTTWYDDQQQKLPEPAAGSKTVTLSADPYSPSLYKGDFTVADGLASITNVTVTLADGAGHSATMAWYYTDPVPVSGTVAVQVTGYVGAGDYITVSAGGDAGGNSSSVTATGETRIEDLPPGSYEITASLPFTPYWVTGETVEVQPGLTTVTSLELPRPTALQVQVVEMVDGQEQPVPGASFWINDNSGQWLGSGYIDKQGQSQPEYAFRGVTNATSLTVFALAVPGGWGAIPVYKRYKQTDIALTGSEQTVRVVMERYPRTTVSGTVKLSNPDTALKGVTVWARQQVNEFYFSVQATTDADGRYTMELIDNFPVTYEVSAGKQGVFDAVRLETPVASQDLVGTPLMNIRMEVYTRRSSQSENAPEEKADLTQWGELSRFNAAGSMGGQHVPINHYGGPNQLIAVKAGEQLSITMDAGREGWARQTVTQTMTSAHMNADTPAVFTFHITDRGQVKARILNGSTGQPFGQWQTRYWAGRVQDNGNVAAVTSGYTKADGGVAFSLDAGNYQIRLEGPAGYLATTEPVTVQDGTVVDLGDIALATVPANTGSFTGTGNDLSVNPLPLIAGSTAALRVAYKNNSSQAAGGALVLTLPADATAVLGSLTRDGAAVADATADEANHTLRVPIGALAAGASGVVRLQVQLPAGGGTAAFAAAIEEADVTSEIGQVFVPVAGLTLAAPSATHSSSFQVSGRAPNGWLVRVMNGDTRLAETTVKGTVWRLNVSVPDPDKPTVLRLNAVAIPPEGVSQPNLVSRTVAVNFDPQRTAITSITMAQDGKKTITWNPAQGPARFAYVYYPGGFTHFTVKFEGQQAVSKAWVKMGDKEVEITRDATSEGQIFKGDVPGTYYPGPISVRYELEPIADYANVPEKLSAVTDLLYGLPEEMQAPDVTEPQTSDDSETGEHKVTSTVTMGKFTINAEFSITPDETFTPTPEQEQQAAGGIAYGLSYSLSEKNDSLLFEYSGWMPTAALDRFTQAEQQGGTVRAQAAGWQAVKGALEIAEPGVKGALMTNDLQENFGEIKKAQEWTEQLDQLEAEWNAAGCPPDVTADWSARAASIQHTIGVFATAKGVINVVGGVVAGAAKIPVVGDLAAAGFGQIAGGQMDADIELFIGSLRRDVHATMPLKCKPPDGPSNWGRFIHVPGGNGGGASGEGSWGDDDGGGTSAPAADPVWLIDPSGYVFEAVAENRLDGVTATILYQNSDGSWSEWDAEEYGMKNPQTSDPDGKYGWDVPKGRWKVHFEKEGYLSIDSWEMDVPPPQTEVNVGMVSVQPAAVSDVTVQDQTAITVTFDRYVRVSTLSTGAITVTPADGEPVAGMVAAVDTVTDANSYSLTRTVRFVPTSPLTDGKSYTVTVSRAIQDYNGRSLAATVTRNLTISAVPPAEVTAATAGAGNGKVTVTWTDPTDADFAKVRIAWKTGSGSYTTPVEVAKGAQTYTITGLTNGSTYTIKLTTVDTSGNESAGAIVTAKPTAPVSGGGGGYVPNPPVPQPEIPKPEPEPEPETPRPEAPAKPPAPPQLPAPPQNPNEVRTEVGAAAAQVVAFDNAVSLEIAPETFRPGAVLKVRRVTEPARTTQPALAPASPVYEFTAPAQPQRPVTVAIRYDRTRVTQVDPRKLAVYRQDDHDPTRWKYIGGVVDPEAGVVRTQLTGFSRYAVMTYDRTFADLHGHWSRGDVEVLVSRYLVSGVSLTEFQPDRNITRAEFTKLLVSLLAQDPQRKVQIEGSWVPTFVDVGRNTWYYNYVETAARLGLIQGFGGRFRPDDSVTRQEMAVLILRALGLTEQAAALAGQNLTFSDAAGIQPWAQGYVALAVQQSLMRGVGEGRFEPTASANRAQAAVVVLRAMERLGLVAAKQ